MQNLVAYLNLDTLYTSNSNISITNNFLSNIERSFNKRNYTINDLSVTNNDIVPLSGILQGYFQKGNSTSNFSNKNTELNKAFLNTRFFKLGLLTGLGSLFLILLVNFIFFSSYNSKINQLNTDLSIHEAKKLQVSTLRNRVIAKEKLVDDLNNVLQSEISRFIDEIAASVPENTLLNKLSYQPIETSIRKDKEIRFSKGIIKVSGITKEDANFSSWTEVLAKKDWIEEIIINDFSSTKKGKSNFEFLIRLDNDQ